MVLRRWPSPVNLLQFSRELPDSPRRRKSPNGALGSTSKSIGWTVQFCNAEDRLNYETGEARRRTTILFPQLVVVKLTAFKPPALRAVASLRRPEIIELSVHHCGSCFAGFAVSMFQAGRLPRMHNCLSRTGRWGRSIPILLRHSRLTLILTNRHEQAEWTLHTNPPQKNWRYLCVLGALTRLQRHKRLVAGYRLSKPGLPVSINTRTVHATG